MDGRRWKGVSSCFITYVNVKRNQFRLKALFGLCGIHVVSGYNLVCCWTSVLDAWLQSWNKEENESMQAEAFFGGHIRSRYLQSCCSIFCWILFYFCLEGKTPRQVDFFLPLIFLPLVIGNKWSPVICGFAACSTHAWLLAVTWLLVFWF